MKKKSMMMTVIAVLFVVFVLVNAGLVVTYPNEYTRSYVSKLIEAQTSGTIDTVTGASSSGTNFRKLTEAVISQARKGEPNTIIVE